MGRTGKYIEMGKIGLHLSEAFRGQEFFDREMRILNDLGPIDVGKGNQTGTRRKHVFFRIPGTPIHIVVGKGF
jgi:hypothetical protein